MFDLTPNPETMGRMADKATIHIDTLDAAVKRYVSVTNTHSVHPTHRAAARTYLRQQLLAGHPWAEHTLRLMAQERNNHPDHAWALDTLVRASRNKERTRRRTARKLKGDLLQHARDHGFPEPDLDVPPPSVQAIINRRRQQREA